MALPAAAWYADPHNPTRIRWWDGNAWTEHVRERPVAPPPPSTPAEPSAPPVAAPEEPIVPLVSASFDAPVAAATDARVPVPPSPFGPLASATPVAPIEPPRFFPTTPMGQTDEPSRPFSPVDSLGADEAPRPFSPVAPIAPADTPRPFSPAAPIAPADTPRPFSPVAPVEAAGTPRPFSPVAPVAPVAPADAPRPFSSVERHEPADAPRAFSPVPPLEAMPAAAATAHLRPGTDAPSAGAATPPPMFPTASSQHVSITPHGTGRRLRFAIAGLLIVVIAAGVGVVATGRLNSLTGGTSTDAPAGFQVHEGDGYQFQVPDTWSEAAAGLVPAPFKVGYTASGGSVLLAADQNVGVDENVDGVRQATIDEFVHGLEANGGVVVSRETAELQGATAEHIVLKGTTKGSGVPFQLDLYVVLHKGRLIVIALDTLGVAGADAATAEQFQAVISSARFD